jgi:hypothetical protein
MPVNACVFYDERDRDWAALTAELASQPRNPSHFMTHGVNRLHGKVNTAAFLAPLRNLWLRKNTEKPLLLDLDLVFNVGWLSPLQPAVTEEKRTKLKLQ